MIFLEPIIVFVVFTALLFTMYGEKALIFAESQGDLGVYCLKLCTWGAGFTAISYVLGAVFNS